MPVQRCGACCTFLRSFLALSVAFNISSDLARAALVINEVLYDPDGPDAGCEFVEIMNTGPFAATLEGLALEAGDGARENDWKMVWSGRSGVAIGPGGIYRIGLTAPGDGEPGDLALQNGPDGVRLMKNGFELDRLGWGNLAHPEYYEGAPAPAVRSGHSLSRRSDGIDTDDNAADFEEATPTPGRPNHPRVDWAIRIASFDPIRPRPGDRLAIRIREENLGTESGFAPSAEIDDGTRAITLGWDQECRPGEMLERFVSLEAPVDSGRITLRARLLARDPVPENDSDSITAQVGIGAIRITEILASPRAGGPEWIEVLARTPESAVLSGYYLFVRGRAIRLLPRAISESTRIGIVTEDSARMCSLYPGLRPAAIWRHAGSWPRIRDGEESGAISDSISIRGGDGVIEEIALPGAAPGAGVSLERIGADLTEGPTAWVPCSDPSGSTPGRIAGTVRIPDGAALSIHPRIVHPGSVGCEIEGGVGDDPGEVRLILLDLSGREVRCLLRGIWVAGSVSAVWDGRDELGGDAPPGVYVAVLEIARKGKGIERRRAALAVAPGTEP